jgi:hypothetical protein
MEYGKELATTLQQQTYTDLAQVRRLFGTPDIALIIASIIRGLHRAAELEARLVTRLGSKNPRVGPICAPYLRLPSVAKPADPHAGGAEDAETRVARMPTPRDIAAALRRRPIGAVIGDICRDLGILPSHPLWREISSVMLDNNGNVGTLLLHIIRRPFVHLHEPPAIAPAGIVSPGIAAPAIASPRIISPGMAAPPAIGLPGIVAQAIASPTIALPAWPAPYPPMPAASGAGPP